MKLETTDRSAALVDKRTRDRRFRYVNVALLVLAICVLLTGAILDFRARQNAVWAMNKLIGDANNVPDSVGLIKPASKYLRELQNDSASIEQPTSEGIGFIVYIVGIIATPAVLILWLLEITLSSEDQIDEFRDASDVRIRELEDRIRGIVDAEYIERRSDASDQVIASLRKANYVFNTVIGTDYDDPDEWRKRSKAIDDFLRAPDRKWNEIVHPRYLSLYPLYKSKIMGWLASYPNQFKLVFVNDASAYIDFLVIGYGSGTKDQVYFGWNRSQHKSLPGVFCSQNFELVTLFKSLWAEMEESAVKMVPHGMTVGAQACGLWCDAIYEQRMQGSNADQQKRKAALELPWRPASWSGPPAPGQHKSKPIGYGLLLFSMDGRKLNVSGLSFWTNKDGALELNHKFTSQLGANFQEDLVISGPHRSNESGTVTGVSLYKFGTWDTAHFRPMAYEGMFASLTAGAYSIHGYRAEGKVADFTKERKREADPDAVKNAHLEDLDIYDAVAAHIFAHIDPNKLRQFVDNKIASEADA